eukprot:gene18043-22808_t
MGTTIAAQNVDYATVFKASTMVPAGSTITKVSWRYGLSNKAPGFEAVLCWRDQQPCWNVTNSNSGNTQWFNGKDASQAFTLHYHVKSSGPLGAPSLGQMNQIVSQLFVNIANFLQSFIDTFNGDDLKTFDFLLGGIGLGNHRDRKTQFGGLPQTLLTSWRRPRGSGLLRIDELIASSTAKSAAGSVILTPPT